MSGDGAYAGSVGYGVVAVWRTSSTAHCRWRSGQYRSRLARLRFFAIRADAPGSGRRRERHYLRHPAYPRRPRSPYDVLAGGGTPPSGGMVAQPDGAAVDTEPGHPSLAPAGKLASAFGATDCAVGNTSQLSPPGYADPALLSRSTALGGPPPFLLAAPDGHVALSSFGGQGTGASLIRTGPSAGRSLPGRDIKVVPANERRR